MFVPIIYFFFPETGSSSLEEVDLLFENATVAGNPWLSVVEISKRTPYLLEKAEISTEGSSTSYSRKGSESEKGNIKEDLTRVYSTDDA
jgi:hypothetical protein